MAATSGWLTVPTWLREAFKGKRALERSISATATAIPPLGEGRIRVQSAGQLLAPPERQARVQALEELTRVTPAHFEALYRQALRNYAAYVQQLPASEAHHHAGLGGLLDHGLEAAVLALKLRRGHLLPPGAATEVIDAQADLWSYACFTAVLLHDIGKPAVDQKVELFDKHNSSLGPWDPWAGSMEAYAYEARFVRNRNYHLYQRAAPLLARFIVPVEGLRWLTAEREVLTAWLAIIDGIPEEAGPLGNIVQEADRLSSAADLTGNVPRQMPTVRVRPLHERLITGLRYLLDSQQLPLNRPGAAGWLIGDELWLVVKTALDALRAHLLQEGQSGIPGDNRRLMDELQQRGVLIPNGERAVWSAQVTLGEWQQALTLLRFPASRLWPDPPTRPESCRGAITPLAEPNVALAPGLPPRLPKALQLIRDANPWRQRRLLTQQRAPAR
ncbi:MAG: MobH family relaxase [Gammaproteobacteria bacterium]